VLAPLAQFTLAPHPQDAARGRAGIPARLDWVDAVLFPTGLGFLLLRVRLRAERPGLAGLVGLNGGLRNVQPPGAAWRRPVLPFADGQAETSVRGLVDALTEGLAGASTGPAFGGHGFVLSYVCTDLGSRAARLAPGAFPNAEDRVLFEYAACI